MFELDGSVRPADPFHERGAMVGFDEASSFKLGAEHVEVVSDDSIEILVAPRGSDFCLVCHARPIDSSILACVGTGR